MTRKVAYGSVIGLASALSISHAQEAPSEFQTRRMADLVGLTSSDICNIYVEHLFKKASACSRGSDQSKYSDEASEEYVEVISAELDEYIEYRLTVAGKKSFLSDAHARGYERIIFRILFFYNHRFEAIHYIYMQEPAYNLVSFAHVLSSSGTNTRIIEPRFDAQLKNFQDSMEQVIFSHRDALKAAWDP